MALSYINIWHAILIFTGGALAGAAVFFTLYREKLLALQEMEARELEFDRELSRHLSAHMAASERDSQERTRRAMLGGEI